MEHRTWREIVEADPDHSRRYAQRWEQLAAEGRDLDGEARLVDALAPRGARVLDAGCGTGRVGGYLAERGHDVTGVDLDAHLIDYARRHHPGARWEVADLADDGWAPGEFDVVVSAGNVLAFVAPADRGVVLANLAERLARPTGADGRDTDGRLVIGLGLDRGWSAAELTTAATEAGLTVDARFSTWDLRPFAPDSGFLVAVLSRWGPDGR